MHLVHFLHVEPFFNFFLSSNGSFSFLVNGSTEKKKKKGTARQAAGIQRDSEDNLQYPLTLSFGRHKDKMRACFIFGFLLLQLGNTQAAFTMVIQSSAPRFLDVVGVQRGGLRTLGQVSMGELQVSLITF